MRGDYWDSQLRFSVILPGFQAYLDRMARDSEAVSKGRAFERLAYGGDPRQWAEVTAGNGDPSLLPIIVHGGYWRALEAQDHRFMMAPFLDLGGQVGNVEYRLMPGVRMADVVADVRAGVRALMDRFPDARIVLIGHSAGAHLSVATLGSAAIAERAIGAIALSGVFELAPVAASSLQAEIQLTADETARFTLHPDAARPPVLYLNGGGETHESKRQSVLMAGAGRADWALIGDADHMSLTWEATARAAELLDRLGTLAASD